MNGENLHDIGEVCRLLGVTSRTLRFYEERGIIKSEKPPFGTRRQYTDAQIEEIKHVLVLRSLGISAKKIGEIQRGGADLTAAVAERRAEIESSVTAKIKELRLLEEALARLETSGDDSIFKSSPPPETGGEPFPAADKYTRTIVAGDIDSLFGDFSEKLKRYLPVDAARHVIADITAPAGGFVRFRGSTADPELANTFHSYIEYEKLGVRVTYIIIDGVIHGIWFGYYNVRPETPGFSEV